MKQLQQACRSVINYLRQADILINNYSYGSEGVYQDPQALAVLYGEVCKVFLQQTGTACPFTASDVARVYSLERKKGYIPLRDGKPITAGFSAMTLFGEAEEEGEPVATVYAYLGQNSKTNSRLVKIGYTSQPLSNYLKNLERAYDPWLLATKCGGRQEEKAEHAKWNRALADGREWFYPSEALFDYLRREWRIEPEFNTFVSRILQADISA